MQHSDMRLAPKGSKAVPEIQEARKQQEANARLIAAAPQMLAALISSEIASAELCQGQDPENQCWVTLGEIRAAIAKASGAK